MSVTETKTGGLYKILWDWASSSAGAASEATTYSYNASVIRVVLTPDSATATQPTDAYDVVVNDDDGYDVLHGNGANLTNAASVFKSTSDGLGCMKNSQLTLSVTNAGDTKGGLVTMYLLPIDQKW